MMTTLQARLESLVSLEHDVADILAANGHLLLRRIYVPYDGPLQPTYLLLGDVPSAHDETTRGALSGAAGILMDRLLQAAGIAPDTCGRLYAVPVRPVTHRNCLIGDTSDVRKPTQEEMQIFTPWRDAVLEVIQPKVILALGAHVAALLSDAKTFPITKLHGRAFKYGRFTTIPVFSPSYLIHVRQETRGVYYEEMLEDLGYASHVAARA